MPMFLHDPLPLPPPPPALHGAEQQGRPAAEEAAGAAASGAAAAAPAERGRRTIQPGDMVIVYENINSAKFAYVEAGGVFKNRYGTFRHDDWIGTPFGSRVTAHSRAGAAPSRGGGGGGRGHGGRGGRDRPSSSHTPAGYVHLLAPTPELWTVVLRHRTQILYVADISLVVAELELRPGSVVLEAGTGSGSLTHALARAVAPAGRVASFEFHPARAAEATDELRRHGLSGIASVTLRDVEAEGFPGPASPTADGFFVADGAADAVFLDLPGPWRVVPAAARALRPGGRFCGFSPCMEQVQRTAAALDARGFREVRTVEVLLRAYDVHTVTTGAAAAAAAGAWGGGGGGAGGGGGGAGGGGGGGGGGARKRARAGDARGLGGAEGEQEQEQEDVAEDREGEEAGAAATGAAATSTVAAWRPPPRRVLCWPQADARGHTGYLTFATKFLAVDDAEADGIGEGEEEEQEEEDDDEEVEGEEDGDGA